jgi:hypothetical protein
MQRMYLAVSNSGGRHLAVGVPKALLRASLRCGDALTTRAGTRAFGDTGVRPTDAFPDVEKRFTGSVYTESERAREARTRARDCLFLGAIHACLRCARSAARARCNDPMQPARARRMRVTPEAVAPRNRPALRAFSSRRKMSWRCASC